MSTVRATNFQHASAAAPAIVLAANGSATANVSSINNGPLAGFRNALINGNLDIWQRGTSFTSVNGYAVDRFRSLNTGTTGSVTRQPFTLGQTDVPGEPTYFVRTVVVSSAGPGNFSVFDQLIEDVRAFAGQQVTFSFWAKADAARSISVCLQQFFGTGTNSPSGLVIIAPTKISIGTTWQKVTVTAAMPSLSGKTIGNDNNSAIAAQVWFDAGSNYNANTGSLGHQSGTFDIAQLQFEPGPVATPFEKRPIGTEIALCQRYYQACDYSHGGDVVAGVSVSSRGYYNTTMRVPPTPSIYGYGALGGAPATSAGIVLNMGTRDYQVTFTCSPSGGYYVNFGVNLSAEIIG
jgi:hypothetical protein